MFAVIPAAGLSRRMGRPKLLIDLAGTTVIARLVEALRAADVPNIVVVGRASDEPLWTEVRRLCGVLEVRPHIDPPDMRSSVEHALSAIRDQLQPSDDDGWLLVPADHPVLDANVIRDVIAIWQQHPNRVVIPTHGNERGHPTVLPWSLAQQVSQIPADKGLNWLIRSQPDLVKEWPTSNPAVLLDLDTPEDLERLRQNLGSKQRVGGVVVCGGKSTRMGRPKLSLPFGDEVMLQRVCRILHQIVDPIVVVAAQDQEIPPLPADVHVVRDEYPDQGPLAGIAKGLGALRDRVDAAFVTSCDVPLLKTEFIRSLIERLGTHDAVVPTDGEHDHVLAAVYRVELESLARQLLADQRRRPFFLIQQSDAVRVPTSELLCVDPELDSLRNLNTPDEYEAALARL